MGADSGARAWSDDLRAIGRVAKNAGVFCDFDGTLSAIVPDPERARPVRGAARALHRLAGTYGAVAVISGRPVRFLARRLHARGVRMVGLYGIEERVGRDLSVLPEARAARASVDRVAAELRKQLAFIDGIWVEHKGFAVSVHFRRTNDHEAARALAEPVVAALAASEGLGALTRGRMVIEVGPQVAMDKGEVVRRIIAERGLRAGIVIGDDAGDIPMFEALEGLDLAVRVAVESDESPPELLARADHRIADTSAALRVLRELRDFARG